MALYQSPLTVTLWPSSFLKKYGPMIPPKAWKQSAKQKILTGRILPTTGKVSIYGFSVPEQITEARKLIGYAAQNNTLYDKLTVREHLHLFARLKGLLDEDNVKKEVEE
ncbi:ATP-binding cassette sub-family A member 1 [Trichonephila clavipes]|nr:ATP-binding cassette sub-family A member 1 [Trichonephila clavipes]